MTSQPAVDSVLHLDSISVDFGQVRVLDDISLTVRRGEVVGVVGESGSGKTTLARTVLRAVAPAEGRVNVAGRDVTKLRGGALRAWRRSGAVQYVFQDPLRSLDPGVAVADSIVEGLRIAKVPPADAARRRAAALEAVGLDEDLIARLPSGLSGGQRQRAAIARALVVEPQLLVLDEPVSALDAASRDRVVQALIALRDQRGSDLAMLVISHDIGSLAAMSDRLVVLNRGRIVEDGPTRRVVAQPEHPYTRRLIDSVPLIHTPSANRP
ncbi:ATP-binding cassette domain-containing protein [Microbacterium murale]|uniref:ABC-type glutathione transport system ATPase component n=1 Tax=Microbacterium murale TaxID=1081040 RepID=A0ABU0P4L7_9MICO|nr:ATP-binding cassette domain-containing protein [Microbacterium murale]MDQ0642276.1 ABC-type glutathione transport system ATPase component [Microbacterium murale]